MMSSLRRWLARAFPDPFFTDPALVEDDYRRHSAEPPRYPLAPLR
jgi:hypothetical protein